MRIRTMINSRPLRIAMIAESMTITKNGSTLETKVVFNQGDVQFAEIITRALGATYEFVLVKDGKRGGRRMPDGNWTGVMGVMMRGEADLALTHSALTEQRAKLLSCSYPYDSVRMTFATRNPEYSTDPYRFTKPFSYTVWLIFLAFFVAMALVSRKVFFKRYSFQGLYLQFLAIFLRQPVGTEPRTTVECLFLGSLLVGMMFLSYSYTATLLSVTAFPPLTAVRTIPELAAAIQRRTYQCFGLPDAFIFDILKKSTDKSTRIISENIKEGKNIEEVLSTENSSKIPAFIGGTNLFVSIKNRYFISEDTFFPKFVTILTSKNFCCKRKLDRIISRILCSGLYMKISNDNSFLISMKKLSSTVNEKRMEKVLTLEDFMGEIVIFIAGITLSIIVFLFELLFGKRDVFPVVSLVKQCATGKTPVRK